MRYLTVKDVKSAIDLMKKHQGVSSTIINRGQLEFVLEKPRMTVFGHEQYPELYQKAAVLMEGLTKAHVLNDGNKRCAMMMAALMAKINGTEIITPLKTVRLSVDTAMDNNDEISNQIQQWFKVHTVRNPYHLNVLLNELIEETSVLENLCMADRIEDAGNLLHTWLAFESYSEPQKMWSELVDKWSSKDPTTRRAMIREFLWFAASKTPYHDVVHLPPSNKKITEISDLRIVGHDEASMSKYEAQILLDEKQIKETKDASILLASARRLELYDRWEEALEYYGRILSVDPANGNAYYRMGMAYLYCEKYEKSLDSFKRCQELSPEKAYIRYYIALALLVLGKNKEALKEIRESLIATPTDPLQIYLKGVIQASIGDFESAGNSARLALDNTKADPKNLALIGSALLLWDRCHAALHGNMNAANAARNTLHRSGAIYEMGPEGYREAIKKYKMLLQINPDHLQTLIWIGGAYSNIGEYEKSLEYLRKALETSPHNKHCLESIIKTLYQAGEYDEAMAHLKSAMRLYPGDAVLLNIESKLLHTQNNDGQNQHT